MLQHLLYRGMLKLLLIAIAPIALSTNIHANPWLDAGDMRLRHNLQILSDAGFLKAPLTTWPLSAEDIRSQLRQPVKNEILPPAVQSALPYVNPVLRKSISRTSFKIGGDIRSEALLIRDFSGEGREKSQIYVDGKWNTPSFDIRAKITAAQQDKVTQYLFSDYIVDETHASILATKYNVVHPNNSVLRLDESYISSELGNWKITAGQQSRWWGPAWDGSMILSNNARPIPSISLENINSEAFENKYLQWIGPNKFHMFVGLLESDREISSPKLFGFRFNFKPKSFKNFEVGLSRTLMWGGEDRDESFSGLVDSLFLLNSNQKEDRLLGNTLASVDMRWRVPLNNTKNAYTLYGQYLIEDTADGSIFGGNENLQLGASVSGFSKRLNGSWRTYMELADTSSGVFSGEDRNNTTYNHEFYLDGYRHLGASMGHSIDSDSTMFSLGGILSKNNGDFYRVWLKTAELDLLKTRDHQNPISGENGKKWTVLGGSYETQLPKRNRANLSLQLNSEKELEKDRNLTAAISVGIVHNF